MPRRAALTAVLLAAVPVLAACEKPTPTITMFSGTTSVRTEARTFCFAESDGGCTARGTRVPQLEVRPGATVGLSVDKKVAEKGWVVYINDQQASAVNERLYERFQVPGQAFGETGELLFQVRTAGEDNDEGTGQWEVVLRARR